MAYFIPKETIIEAYQVGSDMPFPDWIERVEQDWENPEYPEYKKYCIHFAEGVRPIDADEDLTHWGMIPGGYWIVKTDIGSEFWYGYVLTGMENEKFECLFEPAD